MLGLHQGQRITNFNNNKGINKMQNQFKVLTAPPFQGKRAETENVSSYKRSNLGKFRAHFPFQSFKCMCMA